MNRSKDKRNKKGIFKRFVAGSLLLFALLSVTIPFCVKADSFTLDMNHTVAGGSGYELWVEGGDLHIRFSYSHNSTATFSYHTTGLMFTSYNTGGNPRADVNMSYYPISNDPNKTNASGGLSFEEFVIPSDAFVRLMNRTLGSPAKGTVYISQEFKTKSRTRNSNGTFSSWKLGSETYRTLDGIQNAANSVGGWSTETYMGFGNYFDVPLEIDLTQYSLFVDEEPSEGGTSSVKTSGNPQELLAGDSVSVSATAFDGYMFKEWEVVLPAWGIDGVSGSTNPNISFEMPKSNVELIAHFEKLEPGATPVPTKAPIGSDIEQVLPTPTPVPQGPPYYTTTTDKQEEFHYYNTTDKGYYFTFTDPIASADKMRVQNGRRTIWGLQRKSGTVTVGSQSFVYTSTTGPSTNKQYTIATDDNGNEWYCYATSYNPAPNVYIRNAYFVHPKTYNGIDVYSSRIGEITELVFPSYVWINGNSYPVNSIGGYGATYQSERVYVQEMGGYEDRPTYANSWSYSYGDGFTTDLNGDGDTMDDEDGWYHCRIKDVARYGVIGNGSFEADASDEWFLTGSQGIITSNVVYHNYNTTLKRVVISNGVNILANAFMNCQALEELVIPSGVKISVGANAFEGAEHLSPYTYYVDYEDTSTKPNYEQGSGVIINKESAKMRYVYNDTLSNTTVLQPGVAEWKAAVVPAEYFYIPRPFICSTIGTQAFLRKENLIDIHLQADTINANAFQKCRLNSITITKEDTVINGSEDTLGTKGRNRLTVIYTDAETTAMYYGIEHCDFYRMYCGYDVTYDNNQSPEQLYTNKSTMAFHEIEIAKSYGAYAIDKDGNLWDTSGTFPTQILPGKKFTHFTHYNYLIANAPPQGINWTPPSSTPVMYSLIYATDGSIYKLGAFDSPIVPENTHGHIIVKTNMKYADVSNGTVSSGNTIYNGLIHYFYYITENGELWRVFFLSHVNSTSSWSNQSGSGSSWAYTTGSLGRVGTKEKIPLPPGVTAKAVYRGAGGGSSDCEKAQLPSGVASNYDHTAPNIIVIGSDNKMYELSGHVEGYRKLDSYGNSFITSSGFNGSLADGREVPSCPASYYTATVISESTNINSIVSRDTYKVTYIDDNGDLVALSWASNSSTTSSIICAGKNFTTSETIDGHLFLYDKDGGVWIWESEYEGSVPVYLFDNASIKKTWEYEVNSLKTGLVTAQYGGSVPAHVDRTLFLLDNRDRLWCVSAEEENKVVPGNGYNTAATTSQTKHPFASNATLLLEDVQLIDFEGAGSMSMNLSRPGNVSGPGTSITPLYHRTSGVLQILALKNDGSVWGYVSGKETYPSTTSATVGVFGEFSKGTLISKLKPLQFVCLANDRTYTNIALSGTNSFIQDEGGQIYGAGSTGPYLEIPDESVSNSFIELPLDTLDNFRTGILRTDYFFAEIIARNMFTYDPMRYRFSHWTANEDGSGEVFLPGQVVELTGNTRYYAQWKTPAYEIYYDANGGYGAMDKDSYPITSTVFVLSENLFTNYGYEFLGWNTKPDGSGTSYTDKATVDFSKLSTETLILYAQWREITTYTVYVAKEPYQYGVAPVLDTSKTITLSRGVKGYAPAALSGKTSTISYNTNKQGAMTDNDIKCIEGSLSTATATLSFATWELYSGDDYYNSYAPGSTLLDLVRKADDVLVLYPAYKGGSVDLPVLSCDGYEFLGWTCGAQGFPFGSFANPSVTGETLETYDEIINLMFDGVLFSGGQRYTPQATTNKMFAYWKPDTYEISIALDAPGAEAGDITLEQSSLIAYYGEMWPDVTPPTSDIFILLGYYTQMDGAGTQTHDEFGNGLTRFTKNDIGTSTIYAYMVAEREVTLDGQGATTPGTTVTTMKFKDMPKDIIPPKRTGYIFQGYFTGTKGTGTQYYNAGGKGTTVWMEKKTDVLYAYWKPITYTVKINYGNGYSPDAPTQFTVAYDEAFSLNYPYANKPGYEFAGWNIYNTLGYSGSTTASMETSFINLTYTDKATVTFTATYAWADDIYLITFVANPLEYQLEARDVQFNEWNANGKVLQTETACWGYYLTTGGNSSGLYDKSQTQYGGPFPTFKKTDGTVRDDNTSTFVGWNTRADGLGTFYTSAPAVTNAEGGLTLYAIWEDNTTASITATKTDSVWVNEDVTVTLTGRSNVTGVYRMLLGLKTFFGEDVFATTWYPAGMISRQIAPTQAEVFGSTSLVNNAALTYYNRSPIAYHATYTQQGHYTVVGDVFSRSEKSARSVEGDSAEAETSFKIDKTAPAAETLVVQKSLEDYADILKNLGDAEFTGELTTYFEVNADDTANAEFGSFVHENDVAGIKEAYVVIADVDNPVNEKRYELTPVSTIPTYDGSGILSGKYVTTVDLYAEFPEAIGLTCTIFVEDMAGNLTQKTERNLANFSVYAQIYNVNNNKNLSSGTAYFQAGEFGYVNIWTYGYVEGLSLDFGEVGREADREITEGLLLPEYALNLSEDDVRLYVDSTKNSSFLRVDGLRIPTYFELEQNGDETHSDGTPKFMDFLGEITIRARKRTSYAYGEDDFVIYDKISNDYHYRVWPLE